MSTTTIANQGANAVGGIAGINTTYMLEKVISNTLIRQPLRETPFYALGKKIPHPLNAGIGLDGDIAVGGSTSPARGTTSGTLNALPGHVSVSFTRVRRLAPVIYPLDPGDTGSSTQEATLVTEEVFGTATLWGNKLGYTGQAKMATDSMIFQNLIELMNVNMVDSRDTHIQAILARNCTNIQYGYTSTGSTTASNASMDGTYLFNEACIDNAVATLEDGGATYFGGYGGSETLIAESNESPRPAGTMFQHYVAIVSNRVAKNIANTTINPSFLQPLAYNKPENLYYNEIGVVHGVRVLQSNSMFNLRRMGVVGTTAITPGIVGSVIAGSNAAFTGTGYVRATVTAIDAYGHESRIWGTSTNTFLVGATNGLRFTLPSVTGAGISRTAILAYKIYVSDAGATVGTNPTPYLVQTATVDGTAGVNTVKGIAASATANRTVLVTTLPTTYAAEIPPAVAATGKDSTIWFNYIMGMDAYSVLERGPVEVYLLTGADKTDPYNLMNYAVWKTIYGAFLMDTNFIIQVRTNSTIATTAATI